MSDEQLLSKHFRARIQESRHSRRTELLEAMRDASDGGLNCHHCDARCCTREANSMMITPLEAADLYLFLEKENRLGKETINLLNETIVRERLDTLPSDGRRALIRRTYTCPFLGEAPRACTISRQSKPYGCLAFNPRSPGQTSGGDCHTDDALRHTGTSSEECQLNEALADELGLDWKKAPIPIAIRDFIVRLSED